LNWCFLKKSKPKQNRFKPTGFGSVILEQKPVQTDRFRFGYFRAKTGSNRPVPVRLFYIKTKNYIIFGVIFVISNGFGFGVARFFFSFFLFGFGLIFSISGL
jgi:hypothetical protein